MSSNPTPPQMLPNSALGFPNAQRTPGAFPPAMQGPPGAPSGGGLEMSDIIGILKRRKVMIMTIAAAIYCLAVAGTFVLYFKFPKYRSTAILEVEPPSETWSVSGRLVDPKQMAVLVQSEAQKLKQYNLLREVLRDPEVQITGYYASFGGDSNKCMFELRDDLGVSPSRDNAFITVSLSTAIKDDGQKIVAKVVSAFRDQRRSDIETVAGEKLTSMQKQQTELANKINEKGEQIRLFRESADIPAMEGMRASTSETVNNLNEQLSVVEADLNDYQTQLNAIAGRAPHELQITPEMVMQVEADPIVRYRREQAEAYEIDIEAKLASGRFGRNHRDIKAAEARRQQFRDAETARREELFEVLRAQHLDILEQAVARLTSRQVTLLELRQEEEGKQRDLDRNIQQYQDMTEIRSRLEAQLRDVNGKIADAEQAASAEHLNRIRLVQESTAPPKPTWPNIPIFLAGGFFLSIALGVGLAFIRELADQAVRTPVDIARHAHLSVFGCVPELDDEEENVDDIELASYKAPRSLIAESFRQIRTNLLFSGPEEAQKSLLITSPAAEDGKTAVAVNMAITLAQGGQRVLLIDANFRRPTLHRIFQLEANRGLSNALVGQIRVDEGIKTTMVPNLDVLPSGPLPPTPAELLGTTMMKNLIAEATTKYDRVILDGPPILLMSDAQMLSMQVAGVVIVSRAANNTKGAMKRATDQLQRIGARVLGAILDGVEARPGGYFKRQYREFYDYVSDETVPQEMPALTDKVNKNVDSEPISSEDDPFENVTRPDDD